MINFNYLQDSIDATNFTYEKMLASSVQKVDNESTQTGVIKVSDITALISFNGDVIGSMLISMDEATALKTISKFLMFEQTEVNDDILDGLEEIVNIVAGAAAARFKAKAGLGLPTILLGENQRIRGSDDSPWKLHKLNADSLGEFLIGITLKEVQ